MIPGLGTKVAEEPISGVHYSDLGMALDKRCDWIHFFLLLEYVNGWFVWSSTELT
jgi:hypothetical protein